MKTPVTHLVTILLLTLIITGCSTARIINVDRSRVTSTAEQAALLKRLSPDGTAPHSCLGVLLEAADKARRQLATDPNDVIALSNYNFAVARIVGTIDDAKLDVWGRAISCGEETSGTWTLQAKSNSARTNRFAETFRFIAADRFRYKGRLVGSRTLKHGLGAPLVIVGQDPEFDHVDSDFPNEDVFYGLTAIVRFKGSHATIDFIDPLEKETVSLDGRTYPLRADFQAPLALSLVERSPTRERLDGFFSAPDDIKTARLVRLQPYNPKKTPVILVHGLGDTSAIWMPLVDFLRTDARIRENFQFWSFRYPSGIPYPLATNILRNELDRFRATYPNHKDTIVIGHSMGGMISRLLVADSGTTLWNALYDTAPEDMDLPPHELARLRSALIFKPRRDVARVIYVNPSHRGADLAKAPIGKFGTFVIGDPGASEYVSKKSLAYLRPEVRPKGRKHLPNSIALLDPDATFVLAGDTLPHRPGLKFHSILGDRGLGGHLDRTPPCNSDGVVPYWSSHLDGAASELIIPSGHWSLLHPLGMAEIKRILLLHK